MIIGIRPYKSTDLLDVIELMQVLGYPSSIAQIESRMERIEKFPHYYTFIAEIENQAVGMMGLREVFSYEEDGAVAQISLLVTKQQYQGQGIGTALICFAEQWALDRDSNYLILSSGIKPERTAAHQLYKRMGFDITGHRFVKRLNR